MGDLLYSFTEWLRTTPLTELSLWLSETWLSQWIVTHFWATPIIQTVHILGIAGSFASVLMINARMFGIAGSSSMAETSSRYIKVLWGSLVVLLTTGLLMIVAEPVREFINPIFWIKIALVTLGTLTAIAFHKGVLKHVPGGREIVARDKVTGAFLVVVWIAIMFAGRWIAYAPV